MMCRLIIGNLLPLILLFSISPAIRSFSASASHDVPIVERRCWGSGRETISDLLSQPNAVPASILKSSTCQGCKPQPNYNVTTHHQAIQSRISIILPPWVQSHTLAGLAAHAVLMGQVVELHYLHDPSCRNEAPNEIIGNIASSMMNSFPCDAVVGSLKPLVGKSITLEGLGSCDTSTDQSKLVEDKSPYEQLLTIEPIMKALEEVSGEEVTRYDVVVVDASNVAAVFWAERLQLPVIMLATPNHMNLLTENDRPWEGIRHAIQRRIRQINIGWQFSQMNQIRKNLGLPLYRMPSDYFLSAVQVLLHHPMTIKNLPNHFRYVQPHAPHCVFCDSKFPVRSNMTVAIMPNMDIALKEARAILRGVHLARLYFQQQAVSVCEKRQNVKACRALKRKADLRAVMLVEGWPVQYVPELVPSFVSVESSHILDAMARHAGDMFAVISHCDSSSALPAAAGLSLICIPKQGQSLDAYARGALATQPFGHNVARAVISAADATNKRNQPSSASTPPLFSTVHIVETLAKIRHEQRRRNRFSSAKDLRRILNERLGNAAPPRSSYDTMSWMPTVLATSVLLLAAARLFFSHPERQNYQHPMMGLFADLDPLLVYFQQWLRDEMLSTTFCFPLKTAMLLPRLLENERDSKGDELLQGPNLLRREW